MLAHNKKDLETALGCAINGDYGAAFYYAEKVYDRAIWIDEDIDARREAFDLAQRVYRFLKADFVARARILGLNVNPNNELPLLQEHSPHLVRLSEIKHAKKI